MNSWLSANIFRYTLGGNLLLGMPLAGMAQNLVVNPSFEIIADCPQYPIVLGFQQNARPAGWLPVNDTPDYFNTCEPYGTEGSVPVNMCGWQQPFDGEAYSGMYSFFQNGNLGHEMMATELNEALVTGQTYYVSFYANAAAGGIEWPMMATSHLGALFTMNVHEWVSGMPLYPLHNFAHVYSTSVVSDTANWTLISGSFVADSTYRYMVIGNHFDNTHASGDTIVTPDSTAFLYRAYTYVDQVCVSPSPAGCPLALGLAERSDVGFGVFPNPATDMITVLGVRAGMRLVIVDALGQFVMQGVTGSDRVEVNTTGWSRGCYMAQVFADGRRRSSRFVLIE